MGTRCTRAYVINEEEEEDGFVAVDFSADDDQEGFYSWEFIYQSEVEDDDVVFVDEDNDLGLMESQPSDPSSECLAETTIGDGHDLNFMMEFPPWKVSMPEYSQFIHSYVDDYFYEEDYDYDYDLEDDFVPFVKKNKSGKQKMRKMEKRGCSKFRKSKRLTNSYSRPACVLGKHGLWF